MSEPGATQCRRTESRNKESPKTFTQSQGEYYQGRSQALAKLRKDQSGVILTADKGVALAVMDRTEYNIKS